MRISFIRAELNRIKAREVAGAPKIEPKERKKRVLLLFFTTMGHVIDLPINTNLLQLAGTELVGDFLVEFSDCKNALFYYAKAVTNLFSPLQAWRKQKRTFN